MTIGDVNAVSDCDDVYYVDVGLYDVAGYGSVYLVDAERPAVVDTGTGANTDAILDAMDELEIAREDLAYLLVTHVHLDHAGGAGYLAEACPNAEVRTHDIGVPHLVDPTRLVEGTKAAVEDQWEFYAEPLPVAEERIEGVTGGDTIDLGDRTVSVVEAPGHAPHQVVFHDDGDDIVFTADVAGLYIPSEDRIHQTSPPPQFDLDQALADVNAIAARDPEVLCFAHFGPRPYDSSVLEQYKRTLVEWVEAVRQKRAELDDDDAVIDHFVEHTETADVWGERKARAEARMNTRGVLAYLDYVAKQLAEE
ncbi:MAG: MBL fold metallo-hydrolase [Halobacteriota archaeon]